MDNFDLNKILDNFKIQIANVKNSTSGLEEY